MLLWSVCSCWNCCINHIAQISLISFSAHIIHYPYYWYYTHIINLYITEFYHVTDITWFYTCMLLEFLVLIVLLILLTSVTLPILLFLSSCHWYSPLNTLTDVILYSKISRAVEIIVVIITDTLLSSCYFWVPIETSECTINEISFTYLVHVSIKNQSAVCDAFDPWRVMCFVYSW